MKCFGKLPIRASLIVAVWIAGLFAAHAEESRPAKGKRLLSCFRSVTGVPDNEKSVEIFKQIHGGIDMWGYSERAHKAGLFTFPNIISGWSCPAEKIPAWSVKKSDGSVVGAGTYACWNSPFRDYAVTYMEEYVKKNPVDGVLMDAVWWGIMGNDRTDWCCCEYCKKAYEARFGQEMPLSPSWADPRQMKQCIEWRRDTLEEFYKEVIARVKAVRPDILVNVHGGSSWHLDAGNLFSRISCQRSSDIAYFENYHNEIFYAAFLRGVSRRPTMAHMPYCGDPFHAHDPIAGYSDDEYNAIASGLVAHGSIPVMFARWNEDGGLNKSCISLLEPIFREIEEKEPYLAGASPITYAAIVYSEATKTYYRRDNPDRSSLPHLEGVFETLSRLRIPVEFLLAEMDLKLETLKKFRVVILPNIAILSKPQVEALRQYAQGGGSILATYETGLYDEVGEIKADFDLADVLGVKYMKKRQGEWTTESPDGVGAYLAPKGDFLARLQDMLAPNQAAGLYMAGPAIITQSTAGVDKATLALIPVGDKRIDLRAQQTDIPAVHVNRFGQGRTAYISAPIFKLIKIPQVTDNDTFPKKSYLMTPFARRDGWVVDMTRELLGELAPNPPIKVEGQFHLECTFFEQKDKNRVIVHLLNSTVRELGKVYPMDPAKILIRKDFIKPRRVYSAWPARKELKLLDKGKYLEVTTPGTRIHQIVVIEH